MIILKQLKKKNKSMKIFPFVLKDDYLITKIPAIMQKRKKLGWMNLMNMARHYFTLTASLFSQFSKPILNSFFSSTSVSLGNLSLNGKAFFYGCAFAGWTDSAFCSAKSASWRLRSIAARRLAQNAPLEHFAGLQPSLPKWPASQLLHALTLTCIISDKCLFSMGNEKCNAV